MAISDFIIGEYYISKNLEIHKCIDIKCSIRSSYKFINSKHIVKSLYDFKGNALKKYLKHHKFNQSTLSRFYANNQSITEFFDLILHTNSNLSKNPSVNIKLNICSENDSVSMDCSEDKFAISIDKNNELLLLIENIRFEKAKPINDKILRLKQYLGL